MAEVESMASTEGSGGGMASRDSRNGVGRPRTGSTAAAALCVHSSDCRARLVSLRFFAAAAA